MNKKQIENKIICDVFEKNIENEPVHFKAPSFKDFKEANNLFFSSNYKFDYSKRKTFGLVFSASMLAVLMISLFSLIQPNLKHSNSNINDSFSSDIYPSNKSSISDIYLNNHELSLNYNRISEETNDSNFGKIKVNESIYNFSSKQYLYGAIAFKYNLNTNDLNYLNSSLDLYFFVTSNTFIVFHF